METKKNINQRTIYTMEILDAAKLKFEETIGCNMRIMEAKPASDKQPDAVLQINTPEGYTKTYDVGIKAAITKATLGYAAERMRRFENPAILVTRHVTSANGPAIAGTKRCIC